MTQYVVMHYGSIVAGPATTLKAAIHHRDVRAYNDAMDMAHENLPDDKFAEVVAERRDSYTIHEVTISPALTIK